MKIWGIFFDKDSIFVLRNNKNKSMQRVYNPEGFGTLKGLKIQRRIYA